MKYSIVTVLYYGPTLYFGEISSYAKCSNHESEYQYLVSPCTLHPSTIDFTRSEKI